MESEEEVNLVLFTEKSDDDGERENDVIVNDEDLGPLSCVHSFLDNMENKLKSFSKEYSNGLKRLLCLSILIGFVAYVVAACVIDFARARVLFYLAIIILSYVAYTVVKSVFGARLDEEVFQPIQKKFIDKHWKIIKWIMTSGFVIFALVWIILDSIKAPYRLVSLTGIFVFLIIGFLSSRNRKQIKWRPVLWGMAIQFVLGILILRTKYGYSIFKWIGDRVSQLLKFSQTGSSFVFGDLQQLAFSALPSICYFSALVCLMRYLGMIQFLVKKIGWLLRVSMGTTPPESLSAAGNIFLGSSSTPLLILPFLQGMTESELHALMTSGFASISGAGLAVYVSIGASATHLISASIISAPAGLAMAKLLCPETEDSPSKNIEDIKMEKPNVQNAFEAISEGARISIAALANLIVNLIAFLGIMTLLNAVLGWLGSMVDVPQLSFEFLCSYLFMPFGLVMGVPLDDLFVVGELLGINTFVSTFIAYQRLTVFRNNRNNQTLALHHGTGPRSISLRGEIITTYALCGYSTITSIGISLGILGSFIPERRGTLAKHVVRALVSGTLACFCTACVAGLLFEEDAYLTAAVPVVNSTMLPSLVTNISTVAP